MYVDRVSLWKKGARFKDTLGINERTSGAELLSPRTRADILSILKVAVVDGARARVCVCARARVCVCVYIVTDTPHV